MNWKKYEGFERFPKLELELNKPKTVVFVDDGREVDAATLAKALKAKDVNIKARDSIVFNVEDNKEKRELWLSATNYTNLVELKKVRDENNSTLAGAKVVVERIAEGVPDEPNLSFKKAE